MVVVMVQLQLVHLHRLEQLILVAVAVEKVKEIQEELKMAVQVVVEHRDRILVDPQNQEDVEILPLFPQLWEVLKEMLEELEEMVLVNPVVVEVEPMLLVKLVLQHRVDMVEPVVTEKQIV